MFREYNGEMHYYDKKLFIIDNNHNAILFYFHDDFLIIYNEEDIKIYEISIKYRNELLLYSAKQNYLNDLPEDNFIVDIFGKDNLHKRLFLSIIKYLINKYKKYKIVEINKPKKIQRMKHIRNCFDYNEKQCSFNEKTEEMKQLDDILFDLIDDVEENYSYNNHLMKFSIEQNAHNFLLAEEFISYVNNNYLIYNIKQYPIYINYIIDIFFDRKTNKNTLMNYIFPNKNIEKNINNLNYLRHNYLNWINLNKKQNKYLYTNMDDELLIIYIKLIACGEFDKYTNNLPNIIKKQLLNIILSNINNEYILSKYTYRDEEDESDYQDRQTLGYFALKNIINKARIFVMNYIYDYLYKNNE